jgi:hypothetical protein
MHQLTLLEFVTAMKKERRNPMPEYTKEQIEEAKLYFQGKGCYGDGGFTEEKTVKYSSISWPPLKPQRKRRTNGRRKHCSR